MVYTVGGVEVIQRDSPLPTQAAARYPGLRRETTVLPSGHQKTPAHRGFRTATIYDRDIEVPLRDGTILRADVYRPADTTEKVPILLAWSPYGKSGTGVFNLGVIPGRLGVPQSKLSGYESFEAPDPAEWTARGYAIVNINPQGSFDSEGDLVWHSSAAGRNGYDVVEYLATFAWSNGRVALVGNSWLAMVQWFIAAEQPPHLACIAPLEGSSDIYRESLCRGGVPYTAFWSYLEQCLFGRHKAEDPVAMLRKYPLQNEYWADKRADMSRIRVPAYILASYSTALHTLGSFRGFEEISHEKKWLRVHATQEWYDLYSDECVEDLQLYFDYYLKDRKNGWGNMPRVRLSVLRFNAEPEHNHVFTDWPIPETKNTTLYLTQDNRLHESPSAAETSLSYQSDLPTLEVDAQEEELSFEYTFTRRTYLIGYPRVVLHMSTTDSDDMDVFVSLRKADASGKVLRNMNIPLKDLGMTEEEVPLVNPLVYVGPSGILRASHRKIDVARSTPHWPFHPHDEKELPKTGQIVKLEIGIWPTGIVFEAGEKLMLRVAGHHMVLAEFEPLRGGFQTANKGRHNVHVGGQYSSHLILPLLVKGQAA
ncbi:hypothetical protein MHUMG1_09755 [Metarhizium humberi]|uniref:Xaa-Pro dipeptidyl-peptidase C-terminal domain-containing protein n=1 Tax=Metarhizium humberi TaxID=2596975 RepID=A0A9P8S2Y7_9HYPO|nr:hypothetical protein MHUMG1_09755 [Metarhizium humberi]